MKTSEIIERIAIASKREILRYNSLFKNTADNWGIVTTGYHDFGSASSPAAKVVDVSGYGFTSADDYEVLLTSGNRLCHLGLTAKTAKSFSYFVVDIPVSDSPGGTRPSYYVVIAKGFGGGAGGSITVDDNLDETSENPLKNRTIAGIFESFRQLFLPNIDIPNGRIVLADDFTASYQFSTGVNPADCYIKATVDGAVADVTHINDRGEGYSGGRYMLYAGSAEITGLDVTATATADEYTFTVYSSNVTALDFYNKKTVSSVTKIVMDELELELGNNSGS